jgi:hypothetical protein
MPELLRTYGGVERTMPDGPKPFKTCAMVRLAQLAGLLCPMRNRPVGVGELGGEGGSGVPEG